MEKRPKQRSKSIGARATHSRRKPKGALPLAGIGLVHVERAAGDLRAGIPVILSDGRAYSLVMAAEILTEQRIKSLLTWVKASEPDLLLTPERASALKIRLYTPGVLAIPLKADASQILAARDLADPSRDLANPLRGPFQARRDAPAPTSRPALRLAKIANLLPAAIAWPITRPNAAKLAKKLNLLSVDAKLIDAYQTSAVNELGWITSAKLPLAGAEQCEVLVFRPPSGGREHLALLIGRPSPERPPLVRVHSECLTGDLLGSLKCDCGDQLRGAIRRMSEDAAGGVLLYLAQEGRGIGLVNKLRAYNLQDQGFDTVDANLRLGFESDERQFSVASEILKRLGFTAIRLLTNNPEKVSGMEDGGLAVVERVPHTFPDNPHNADYLKVKARKSGHLL
jgi:GTP cyclohydrolase II